MRKIYFAHPVNIYDMPLEHAMVKFISQHFPDDEIENPNQLHHQEGYSAWAKRQRESDTKHKGMSYFYDKVLPTCTGCVVMPFLDGRMGLGVVGEAKWFLERNKPVWIITPAPTLHLQRFIADPEYGSEHFNIPLISPEESTLLSQNDPALVVPHVETRLRTWTVYGKGKRPYETAHLAPTVVPEGFYPAEASS